MAEKEERNVDHVTLARRMGIFEFMNEDTLRFKLKYELNDATTLRVSWLTCSQSGTSSDLYDKTLSTTTLNLFTSLFLSFTISN